MAGKTTYYFRTEGLARVVDINAIDGRTSDAGSESADQGGFRTQLIERDGSCVLSNACADECTACHILPRAKGDGYMQNLVAYRQPTGPDVAGISDVRNSFLLATQLHKSFGAGNWAFFRTPNFALKTSDVPRQPQLELLPSGAPTGADSGPSRLTVHHFVPPDVLVQVIAPQNKDARFPRTVEQSRWPPAFLTDFWYGCAALRRWGIPQAVRLMARPRSFEVLR
ncbi:hypothetical protein K439DRAFT_935439 [Ramaria rubella]|nr:hypothetical protein K439DRAFT_935439 [Ramaria rubella]